MKKNMFLKETDKVRPGLSDLGALIEMEFDNFSNCSTEDAVRAKKDTTDTEGLKAAAKQLK